MWAGVTLCVTVYMAAVAAGCRNALVGARLAILFSIILVNECSKCSFQVVVHGLHFWQCRKLLVHAEEHSLVGEPRLLNAHY